MIRFIPIPPLRLDKFVKLPTNHIKAAEGCQGKTNSGFIVQKSFEFAALFFDGLTFLRESIRNN
jgi:hypothetical protein